MVQWALMTSYDAVEDKAFFSADITGGLFAGVAGEDIYIQLGLSLEALWNSSCFLIAQAAKLSWLYDTIYYPDAAA